MQGTTTFGPVEIWHSMGVVGHTVLIFLLLMSIYSIAVMLDRHLLFRKARKQSLAFVKSAGQSLDAGNLQGVLDTAKRFPQSHLARIYSAGVHDFNVYRQANLLDVGFEDTLERAMERESVLVTQDFKRGLSGLASIGATAPFVGLFGTVVGIMHAFRRMAETGQGGFTVVATGISEALVTTAGGIAVAVEAVVIYNFLNVHVQKLAVQLRLLTEEYLELVKEALPALRRPDEPTARTVKEA